MSNSTNGRTLHTSRRQFIKWVGLGLLGLVAGACGTSLPHFTVEVIGGNTFSPSLLAVPQGSTITWYNRSTEACTVTCDPAKIADAAHVHLPANAPAWDSGPLYPGQFWSNTFPVAGTFLYTTTLGNPESAIGVIVVNAPS